MTVPTESDIARELGMTRQALQQVRRSGRCSNAKNVDVLRAEFAAHRSARKRLERAKAGEREINVRVLKGELVDRTKVTRLHFGIAKSIRERLEEWPARVAAPLAAKLGIGDPHLVENTLAEAGDHLLASMVARLRQL